MYFGIGMSILFWELYRPTGVYFVGDMFYGEVVHMAYGDMVMVGLHV